MDKNTLNPQYPENFYVPGLMMYWQQQYYVIEQCLTKELKIVFSNCTSGEHRIIQIVELVEAFGNNAPIYGRDVKEIQKKIQNRDAERKDPHPISTGGIPEESLKKAMDLKRIIEFTARAIEIAKTKDEKVREVDIIRDCLSRLTPKIKLTRYYDWRRRYDLHQGDALRIAQSFQTARYGKTKHSPNQIQMVDYLLERFHFAPKTVQLRPSFVLERIKAILRRSGGLWIDLAKCVDIPQATIDELIELLLDIDGPPPDFGQVPLYTSLLSPAKPPKKSWFYGRYLYQKELHELEDQYSRTGFHHYGQRVQIPLDLGIWDEMEITIYQVVRGIRKKLLTIWVSFVIDAHARVIPGFHVHVGRPDLGVGLATLRNCIFPKDLTEIVGSPVIMPYGIFKTYSGDNAMAHDSDSYMIASEAVSCNGEYRRFEICFRPPGKPVKGALIERFNGTFAERFKEKMAKIAVVVSDMMTSNMDKQAEYIEEYITRELINIINEYHYTRHSTLHQYPIDCWNEALNQMMGMPKVPPLTDELERRFWPKVYGERFAKENKISLGGLHFVREFGEHLPTYDEKGVKIPYSFHRSTRNIGRLALIQNGKWLGDMLALELMGPDGKLLRQVSKLQKEIAQQLARQAGESPREWPYFLGPDDQAASAVPITPTKPPDKPSGSSSVSNEQPEPPADQPNSDYWGGLSGHLSGFANRPDDE